MKRMYLVLIMVFCGGAIMAQTNVQNSNNKTGSTIQNSTAVNPVSTNTNGDAVVKTDVDQTKKGTTINKEGASTANGTAGTSNSSVDLPGFPVYVNTGNPELDKQNYAAAKELWIQNNQELYNNYVNRSNTNKGVRSTTK